MGYEESCVRPFDYAAAAEKRTSFRWAPLMVVASAIALGVFEWALFEVFRARFGL